MNVAAVSACEQKLVSAYYLKSVSATTFSFCLHRTGSRVRIYTASNTCNCVETRATNNTKPGIVKQLTTIRTGHQMLVDGRLALADVELLLVRITLILHFLFLLTLAFLLTILFIPIIILHLHLLMPSLLSPKKPQPDVNWNTEETQQ